MLRLVIIASLAANAALGFLWWRQHTAPPLPSADDPAASVPVEASSPLPPPEPITGAAIGPFLTDPDLSDADLVARLRHANVPADVIRQIIRRRVHARYADRWWALVDEARQTPYWAASRGMPADLRRQIQALVREERLEMLALLGDDAFAPGELEFQHVGAVLDFLPMAKRNEVGQLINDYAELQMDVLDESRGIFTPNDREIMTYLAAERDRELAALLTPEEYAQFQTRGSYAAAELQQRIMHFPATEDEYLRLFELYNEAIPPSPGMFSDMAFTSADRRARAESWNDLVKRFAPELPAERAALWTDTTDPQFAMLQRVVNQQNLDSGVTFDLLRLGRQIEEQQRAIYTTDGMTPAQRTLELSNLVNRAEQTMEQLLPTPEARTAFQQTMPGRRIEMIKRQLSRPRP